ncbi:hypothetical protein V6N11_038649 [Hibiscus sabdariffa]|uniref:Uncharacterized protein n=1 Tax=Hibiscus sabdariffa TaxID=183260 RepID=A0ABR2SLD6_9ROSI
MASNSAMIGGPGPIGSEKVTKQTPRLLRTIPPIPPLDLLLTIAPSTFNFKNPIGGASQTCCFENLLLEALNPSPTDGSAIRSSTKHKESGNFALNHKAIRVLTKNKI